MSECVECGATEQIHQHHITYEPEKTVPLCASCHRKVHHDESHDLYPEQDYLNHIDTEGTHIRVSDDTWQELNSLKEPGDTFNDVIQRELDVES